MTAFTDTTRPAVVLATGRPEACAAFHDALGDAELVVCTLDGTPTLDGVGDPAARAAEICASAPAVVVLDAALAPAHGLAVARACRDRLPAVGVVLLAAPSVELLQGALRLTRCDVVDPAAGIGELFDALERLAASTPTPASAPSAPVTTGRTVVVLAAKGGCGKTTVSTNLAVRLAASHPGEVVLVDLDLQFGDCATVLGLAPERTILDATGALARSETPKLALTPHPAGLWLLAAPEAPALADELDADNVAALLARLAADFRYVVVDTAAGMDEATLAALGLADELVVLASTDVTAVRNARKTLEALDAIGVVAPRRTLVVNRADATGGITVAAVEAALGAEAAAVVPASPDVPRTTNAGTPVCLAAPNTPAAVALQGLADHLVALDTPSPADREAAAASSKRRWRR